MQAHNFTPQGLAALEWALAFLARHAPEQRDHLQRVATRISFDPAMCGERAWGCVRGDRPWTIFLAQPPETMPSIELLLTLAHEGFHMRVGPRGEYQVFPHRCSDGACSNPLERDRDPIYGLEKILRPKLEAALYAEGLQAHLPAPVPRPAPRQPRSGWWEVLEAVAVTTLVVGVGVGAVVVIGKDAK